MLGDGMCLGILSLVLFGAWTLSYSFSMGAHEPLGVSNFKLQRLTMAPSIIWQQLATENFKQGRV